jgi:cyanobactin maturation PatA/PatG family protease
MSEYEAGTDACEIVYPHSIFHHTHNNTSDHLTKTNFNEMESIDQVSNELAYANETANAIPGGIEPSCACENKDAGTAAPAAAATAKQPPQLVYAIGTLAWEFKSEASRDSFLQFTGNLNDGNTLLDFLDANPDASDDIHFTLNLDATPIYIIRPVSGFASIAYANIRSILRAQLNDGVTRVSMPGMVIGKGRLMMGHEVPVIAPWSYGIYSWSTQALVTAVAGEAPTADGKKKTDFMLKARGIGNFLDRVYFELRNIGMLSRDRAINYAATNAFQIENVFANAVNDQMELDSIDVERSPVGKPGSDCWDVKLMFFNPSKRMEQARKIYRFTVDVSHVIPVTVGQVRSWSVY